MKIELDAMTINNSFKAIVDGDKITVVSPCGGNGFANIAELTASDLNDWVRTCFALGMNPMPHLRKIFAENGGISFSSPNGDDGKSKYLVHFDAHEGPDQDCIFLR